MNSEKGKQFQQVIILIILLVILGGAIFYVFRANNPQRKPAAKPASTSAAQPGAPATANGSASEGGELTAGAAAAGGKQPPTATGALALALNIEANPNSFTVYALSPPKNPFVQEERWYSDVLKEQLPGYPALRDKGYFENDEPYIPNPNSLFEEPKEIVEATLDQETVLGKYTFEGVSADGKLKTSLSMTEPAVEPKHIEWTKDSGVPLSALSEPGWEKRHPELAGGGPAAGGGGTVQAPGGEPGALSIPGGGESAGAALAGPGAAGDVIACAGVNLKDGKSSALMLYNNMPYLVSAGSVLPTHYQVLEVKSDGVVLVELRDGSSKWIPLTGYVTSEKK